MKNLPALLLLIVLAGCVNGPQPEATAVQHNNMNAVLWIQTSAELQGNSETVYRGAITQLKTLLDSGDLTGDIDQAARFGCEAGRSCPALAEAGLRPAVVLDIDETVLDNSIYQARLIADGESFHPVTWDEWLAERSAPAVPGVIEFIRLAQSNGVAVIYLTNRACGVRAENDHACPQRVDTLENMKAVGIPALKDNDQLILRAERPEWDQSEKKIRRKHIGAGHRILMLIGDDIGDFASDIKKGSLDERRAFTTTNRHLFGRHWFQLSNPAYGSWERAVPRPKIESLIIK